MTAKQLAKDAALLVYAARIDGRQGFRREAARLILERDLTLSQSARLLERATTTLKGTP